MALEVAIEKAPRARHHRVCRPTSSPVPAKRFLCSQACSIDNNLCVLMIWKRPPPSKNTLHEIKQKARELAWRGSRYSFFSSGDARGVFTDDLNRARHQIADGFEAKSSAMAPESSWTDIFGGLWHLKALFESSPKTDESHALSKDIWIFSDMMNETQGFSMPALLAIGPERMLERAKTSGLLVPLNGYKIHIYGASPSGLTPQAWITMQKFWTMYFSATGAELIAYSAVCDIQRRG